ncbi:MAG: type I-E CRISPR-associated protein Cas7/Cse4/CasC [Clostridia bacterium]|nr:type I-E CRISPR-associated protein Cas7/Cse4/CasC [Clostridia bacterium]
MKKDRRIFVDIHVLQTVPPSCVNRDDTGSPKTAVYGGATRARVSSQSWKRAMRLAFKDLFDEKQLGLRTKKIISLLSEDILTLAPETAAPQKLAVNVLQAAGLKIRDDEGTDALFFVSRAQVRALAKLAVEQSEMMKNSASKEAKQLSSAALRQSPGVDIALFGRMVADDPSLNTDACAQVAHSISTHRVNNEYDYFTAVDDLAPEDNAGAAHLGTVEFNSSTLYRYATVAVHALNNQLGEETTDAVKKFIFAFVRSMPDGKQNTFANRTLPDAVMVTLRTDQPVNLAGAFERPVPAGENGYVEGSAKRLILHAKNVYADFTQEPELTLVTGAALAGLAEPCSFTELLEKLGAELDKRLDKDVLCE